MPQWFDPMENNSPERDLLLHVRELESNFVKNESKSQYICSGCGKTDKSGLEPSGKCVECRLGRKTNKKMITGEGHFTEEKKPWGESGDEESYLPKADLTSQILAEHGIIAKYEQEKSVENSIPQFVESKTGDRAQGYGTNGMRPAITDFKGGKKTISEVYKMPAVSQTGYDKNASSLHMHLNDGGVNKNHPNRAPLEESLGNIKKSSGEGQIGVVSEIADLLEKVHARL